jgi:hypothetical protein
MEFSKGTRKNRCKGGSYGPADNSTNRYSVKCAASQLSDAHNLHFPQARNLVSQLSEAKSASPAHRVLADTPRNEIETPGENRPRTPKVQGRTGRSFLKAAIGRLCDRGLRGCDGDTERKQVRFAAQMLTSIYNRECEPADAYAFTVARFGIPRAPQPKPTEFTVTAEQYFARKDAAPALPYRVDGRTGSEWCAAVIAYLQYRVVSVAGADRARKLASAEFDALRAVMQALNSPDLPAERKRETPADVFSLESPGTSSDAVPVFSIPLPGAIRA